MPAKSVCVGALLWLVGMAHGVAAQNCQLSVSQPRIDYGVIRREPREDREWMALGTRTLQLNILCAQPSAMALRFTGAAADTQGFQFGQGRFRLMLKHASVDGQPVEWADAQVPGASSNAQLWPGRTLVARASGAPVLGRRLTAQVDIETDLPSAVLQVRSETRLEGEGRFEWLSPAVPLSR